MKRYVVRVPACLVTVSSDEPTHRVRLTPDVVPEGLDVLCVAFEDVPNTLAHVHLDIGNARIVTLDLADVAGGQDVLAHGLPLTKCPYAHTDIVFEYDRAFLMEHEGFDLEQEYVTAEVVHGNELTYKDSETNDVRMGRRITFQRQATGRMVRRVTSGVQVVAPGVAIQTEPGTNDGLSVALPFWDRVWVDPRKHSDESLARFITTFKVHPLDGTPIADRVLTQSHFRARALNHLVYAHGHAHRQTNFKES